MRSSAAPDALLRRWALSACGLSLVLYLTCLLYLAIKLVRVAYAAPLPAPRKPVGWCGCFASYGHLLCSPAASHMATQQQDDDGLAAADDTVLENEQPLAPSPDEPHSFHSRPRTPSAWLSSEEKADMTAKAPG